jgi:hypothetical protein
MKYILIAITIISAVACTTSKLYTPGEKNVNKVETATLAELQQGRDLFVKSCDKCHKLPKIDSRNNESWKKVIGFMAPKAKLNNDQAELIYKYVANR